MDIITISPSASRLWEEVWRLYTVSFPEYERRRISSHTLACEDPSFHTYIAIENGSLLGLLFYWEYDNKYYIEHIAVSPALRGKSIGSSLMKMFVGQAVGKTVLLEIDPPEDEVSIRRLAFYERLGFCNTGFEYTHPSYSKNGQSHRLSILSYPEAISAQEFDNFKDFMFGRVVKYSD